MIKYSVLPHFDALCSNKQQLSNGNRMEAKMEYYQNCCML